MKTITGSLMVLVTSFGFASIVPSLRDYFHDDVRTLRRVIFLGSLIPLICYILWNAVIMGVIKRDGEDGLMALMLSDHATSALITALSHAVHSQWITGFFSFFTSICMVTAFLGVSIGLFDFLSDGLSLKKSGKQGKAVFVLTFFPPLMIIFIKPSLYLHALSYAGVCCVILLLLLPTLMAWRARTLNQDSGVLLVPGGNIVLGLMGITGLILLVVAMH